MGCCIPRPRKVVHRRPLLGDECAICLGVIMQEASECPECDQHMHRFCLTRWKYACKKKEIPFTCPLCRCPLE